MITFCPPRLVRVPTEKDMGTSVLLQAPSTVTRLPGSYLATAARSVASSRPASSATAPNTSSGGVPLATSVATRRSAACSSASARNSSRAWALPIAVETSSVNPASWCSIPAGSPSSRTDATVITPHSRPSTLIGAPADERAPDPRASPVTAAASSARWSTRAGPPRSNTRVNTLRPPRPTRCPTHSASPALLQPPTNSIAWPASYRPTRARSAPGRTCATSSATAANTASGRAALATSVATRRSAACSRARRSSSSRAARSLSRTCGTRSVIEATRAIPRSRLDSSRVRPPGPARPTTRVAPGGYSSVAAAAAHRPTPGTSSQPRVPARILASSAAGAAPSG